MTIKFKQFISYKNDKHKNHKINDDALKNKDITNRNNGNFLVLY